MALDYSQLERTYVRRQDRQKKDDDWMKAFIRRAPFCAIGTVFEQQPFVHTNIFVYDEEKHAIYLHTARTGRTRFNIQHHQEVCFSISEMGRLLPAKVALEFSVEYRGITAFCTASIVENPEEEERVLKLLLEKYCPQFKYGEDYRAVTPEELQRTTVFRLDIRDWTGKEKREREDFPLAFYYRSGQESR
jgi:hypothetical protein